MFEGIAWNDSIVIFPDTSGNINSHSKDVQVDNVYQKQKSQTFTFINIYPNSLQGKKQVQPSRSNVRLTVEQEPM